ncbi:MAG: hypothetical protein K2J27_01465 [Duncaniella sp.]|nr:hypothetical protein [Duncaniella sp.]
MRNIGLVLVLVLFTRFAVSAQSQAAVNVSEGGYGLLKTNIRVNYDHGWGQINDGFSTNVSYEFFRNRKFTVTANARYSSTELSFRDGDLSNGFNPDEINLNGTHIFGQTGFTSTFRSRLFGKPFMAMAMVNAEWSQGGFARVSGIAMGILMLRANRNTQFGIGPLAMINTCSKIPVFMIFMYRHKFNDKWGINLYGGMFGVDYTPTKNNLFSVGADVDVKAFYFKPSAESLPDKCRFTSTSFRPMAKFRRRLATNLYFDLQGGISVKMSSRANGVTGTTEYFDCHQKTAPFVLTGVSYTL